MQLRRRDAFKLLGLAAAVGLILPMKGKSLTKSYKLGKHPATPEACKLRLKDYFDHTKLPEPPQNFGHETLIADWGMYGNGTDPSNPPTAPNGSGDCAWAGPYHAIKYWNLEVGRNVPITTQNVLSAYSAGTGYDPSRYDPETDSNPTDRGSNIVDVANYWMTYGLNDAEGNNHKISAYLALDAGNVDQLWQALYLFGAGIGIDLPEQWQSAFANGQVWDVPAQPDIAGGHYVFGVGRRNGLINVVTWGRTQLMTPAAYETFNDETLVYFSEDMLLNGKNIDGFNRDQLLDDLKELAKESGEPLEDEIERWEDDGGDVECAA